MADEQEPTEYTSADYFKEPVDGYRAEVLPHFEFVFGYPKDSTDSVFWGV